MNLRVQKYAEITLHFESSFLMLTPAQWMVWQPPPQCTVLKYRGVLANSGGRDQNMATDFMFLGLPPYPTSGSATRKCVHTADRRLTDHWDAHGTIFYTTSWVLRGTLETIYCWHPLWINSGSATVCHHNCGIFQAYYRGWHFVCLSWHFWKGVFTFNWTPQRGIERWKLVVSWTSRRDSPLSSATFGKTIRNSGMILVIMACNSTSLCPTIFTIPCLFREILLNSMCSGGGWLKTEYNRFWGGQKAKRDYKILFPKTASYVSCYCTWDHQCKYFTFSTNVIFEVKFLHIDLTSNLILCGILVTLFFAIQVLFNFKKKIFGNRNHNQ